MRPLPKRLPSQSAKWALRIAVFVPILAVMSVISHRGNLIDTPSFLSLLVMIAVIAVIAMTCVFMALRSLWVKGKRGGRKATWALFFCALVFGPYIYGGALWITRPKVNDVATDLIDPPVFQDEVLEYQQSAATIVASELVDAYPTLNGRRYNAALETVLDKLLTISEERGWTLQLQRGRIGADDVISITYSSRSAVLAMPFKVLMRLTDEGESTFLDMRSKSDFAAHDLGANAGLISDFIQDLDFSLIGQIEK